MSKFVRAEVVDDLQRSLWRYLSPNAVISKNPSDSADSPGTAISEQAYRDVLVVHLALSPVTARMIQAASHVISRLPSVASRRQVELEGEVSGDVDFIRTFQRRHETGTETLFVCSPVERRFESLHARVLKTALLWCERIGRASPLIKGRVTESIDQHVAEATMLQQARRASRHVKLGGVRPLEDPTEAQLERVAGRFGMLPIVEYIRHVRAVLGDRDERAIRQLLRDVVLEPSSNDRLFELLVGFRLVDELVANGWTLSSLQAIAGSRDPFAVLARDGHQVNVWDQRAPASIPGVPPGPSTYKTIRELNGLRSASLRPDFVVRDRTGRMLVIEVKLSESDGRGQVRNGITDAMAYLMDRPDLYEHQSLPHAAVVCWDARSIPNPESRVMVCSQYRVSDIAAVVRSWAASDTSTVTVA